MPPASARWIPTKAIRCRLDFDYFLDTTFSVGAGVGAATTFTLRAEKFFTPAFAVGGSRVYRRLDEGVIGATVTWRF